MGYGCVLLVRGVAVVSGVGGLWVSGGRGVECVLCVGFWGGCVCVGGLWSHRGLFVCVVWGVVRVVDLGGFGEWCGSGWYLVVGGGGLKRWGVCIGVW